MNSYIQPFCYDSYNLVSSIVKPPSNQRQRNDLIFSSCRMFGRILVIAGFAANAIYFSKSNIPQRLLLIATEIAAIVLSHDLFVLTYNFEQENVFQAIKGCIEDLNKEFMKSFSTQMNQTKNPFKKFKIAYRAAKQANKGKLPQSDEKKIKDNLAQRLTEGTVMPFWYKTHDYWLMDVLEYLYKNRL